MRTGNDGRNKVVVLFVFIIASGLLFIPSYGREFTSDDYCILRYLFTGDNYLVPGFFRPVGDFTLKLTYDLFGWQPLYFFLGNSILHGINAWLFYLFCSRVTDGRAGWTYFPAVAAILFLTYHSLGEVVLWTIGRGISLAVFFALLSFNVFVSRMQTAWKYLLTAVFYFISLSCYESGLFLPFVLLAVAYFLDFRINYRWWIAILGTALAVSLITRHLVTGTIWGGYSGAIFARDFVDYPFQFMKDILRLFSPSFEPPYVFLLVSGLLIMIVVGLSLRIARTDRKSKQLLLVSLTGILCCAAVSMFFGVSTRSGEGDRFLYLPALFYSLIIAVIIVRNRNAIIRSMLFGVVIIGQLYVLFGTQRKWNLASRYSEQIISVLKKNEIRPLYLINVPSDIEGAYVFRNCLPEALLFHQVDTSGIVIINELRNMKEKDSARSAQKVSAVSYYVWPKSNIRVNGDTLQSIFSGREQKKVERVSTDHVLYWNGERLVPL